MRKKQRQMQLENLEHVNTLAKQIQQLESSKRVISEFPAAKANTKVVLSAQGKDDIILPPDCLPLNASELVQNVLRRFDEKIAVIKKELLTL